MANLVLMSVTAGSAADVVPSLGLLSHEVRIVPPDVAALPEPDRSPILLVDARADLLAARTLCRLIETSAPDLPVIAVVTEGGLSAVTSEWGITDLLLTGAGPAEVDARIRLAATRRPNPAMPVDPGPQGDLLIDASGYTARLRGVPLDLTYKEFELLKCLYSAPGRVFTRSQILDEVWGYDYYGGTRTVDVHVRRLRAKLGPEYEGLIVTVRHVGYRYVTTHTGSDAGPPTAEEER